MQNRRENIAARESFKDRRRFMGTHGDEREDDVYTRRSLRVRNKIRGTHVLSFSRGSLYKSISSQRLYSVDHSSLILLHVFTLM